MQYFVRDFLNDLENACPMSHPSSCKEKCLFSMSQSHQIYAWHPQLAKGKEVQREEMTSFECSAQDTLRLIFTGVLLMRVCVLRHILKPKLTREKNTKQLKI